MKKVAIVMGSDSDLPKLTPAVDKLKELGIPCEVRVISAHRTPMQAIEFSSSAKENGFGVIILLQVKRHTLQVSWQQIQLFL